MKTPIKIIKYELEIEVDVLPFNRIRKYSTESRSNLSKIIEKIFRRQFSY